MTEETVIGKPVYGNQGSNARPNIANANWKIGDEGSHFYRILPPFGLLAASGRWSQYEAIHWGFSLSNGKKRAFRCIQRKNKFSKMVEIECPMCKKIAEQTKLYNEREQKFLAEGKTKQEVATLLQPIKDWLQTFNLQKGHYLNVMRQDQQIGKLFIKIKMKQALDLKLPKFRQKYNLDPIDATQGMWLDFQRSGMGRNDSVYDVAPVEVPVEINGRRLLDVEPAPLSAEVIKRMAKEAFELSTQFKDLSYDEVEMMVSSNGDPAIVDQVFGAPKMDKTQAEPDFKSEPDDDSDYHSEPVPSASSEDQLLAQLAALRAQKAGPSTNRPAPQVSPETEDDFVKQFKAGKL